MTLRAIGATVATFLMEDAECEQRLLVDLLNESEQVNDVCNLKRKVAKIQNFTTETVPSFTADDFRSRYRLTRHSFEIILSMIAPLLSICVESVGRPAVCIEKKMLLFLDYLGHQISFRELSTIYDVSVGKAHAIVVELCEAIVPKLSSQMIRWPSETEASKIATMAYEKCGFPDVIGALDGSYIPFTSNDDSYTTRKFYSAITLQAVALPDLTFSDVFVGCSGRMHDYRVFKYSPLAQKVESDEGFYGRHILADGAYKLTQNCIIPFVNYGNLSPIQRNFNKKHSSCRIMVERSFGLLKERFRRLKGIHVHDIRFASLIIVSACTLHNVCIFHNDDQIEIDDLADSRAEDPSQTRGTPDGITKRNAIANNLFYR